jgi:WXXGXW repeat (2 copies)
LYDATPDKRRDGWQGKTMTSTRLFKNSIATTALAGLILSATVFAQTPASDPYGPAGPPPDIQQQGQYAQPNPYGQQDQYGQQGYPQDPNQQQGPTAAQQAAATITDVPQAPPAIPDYQQPEAPGDGYIWTPGYWAWTGAGYEWVDGAWVEPPYSGALWTPGFWGVGYGGYAWYPGYWGPFVGYYGGLNYGFGYFGIGFYGGYWGGGRFWYNRAYCNIGRGVGYHFYNRSFNGYSGRPGGNSFTRASFNAHGSFNRGASAASYRGSSINGHTSNFAQGANRSASTYNGARSYNGAANYSRGYQSNNGGARSYAQPSQSYNGGARSYSAPSGGSFHGAAPSGGGGGFHGGGGGGGGGSHGGGGGHR